MTIEGDLKRILDRKLLDVEENTRATSGSGAPEIVLTFEDGVELTAYVHDDGTLIAEID